MTRRNYLAAFRRHAFMRAERVFAVNPDQIAANSSNCA